MDIIYFILKYIPFWAVPIALISAEFGYIYWLKSLKKISITFLITAFFCVISIVYYYLAGGPIGAVKTFIALMDAF